MLTHLRHVVLLAFKATASRQDVQQIEEALIQLEYRIDEVAALEWGVNVSPENLVRGSTHCFLLTFDTAADRDTCLNSRTSPLEIGKGNSEASGV